MFEGDNKFYLLGAAGVVLVALIVHRANAAQPATETTSSTGRNPNTIYVPTSSYDIKYVAGDMNTTSSTQQNVGNGNSAPVNVPTPVVVPTTPSTPSTPATPVTPTTPTPAPSAPKTPTSSETLKLTSNTSMFNSPNVNDETAGGTLAPQTVKVIAHGSGSWVQISSSLGAKWIIPNYYKSNTAAATPQPTSTYVIQKGDTLSGISTKFHVPISELESWNHITNPNLIIAGHSLKV